jgi:hypothetical protein
LVCLHELPGFLAEVEDNAGTVKGWLQPAHLTRLPAKFSGATTQAEHKGHWTTGIFTCLSRANEPT